MTAERIVVGVDFSEDGNKAVDYALELAKRLHAEVVLTHVHDVSPSDWAVSTSPGSPSAELSALLQRVRAAGHENVSELLINGHAVDGLCRAGDRVEATMVVVGSHGRTGIKRFLLGSVAELVVRHSPRDVLVVREPSAQPTSILVPTDFSQSSEAALARAMHLAPAGCKVDVVHCWQPTLTAAAHGWSPSTANRPAEFAARGESLIAAYASADTPPTFRAVETSPAEGIVELAADHSLVVMGSHGRRGFERMLLGSVAERTVRHAPCSVMVVTGSESAG